jgi:hypothetical protein
VLRRSAAPSLRLVPLQMRRFRLRRAAEDDAAWFCNLLNRIGAEFGTRVHRAEDGCLLAEIPGLPDRVEENRRRLAKDT